MITKHIYADGTEVSEQDLQSDDGNALSVVYGGAQAQKRITSVVNNSDEIKKRQGKFAWSLLHKYTGCDKQWLDLWVYFIPNRCECKTGYQHIIKELPPDFSSPDAFFAWGVALHNAVNAKLGKPEVLLEDAFSLWRSVNGSLEDKETQH